MKDKLILKIQQFILDMKETSDHYIIENQDKETLFNDLIIPFMQLTNSTTIKDLETNLNILVNNNESDEQFKQLSNLIIESLDSNDIEQCETELKNLISNSFGLINKFNTLKNEKIILDDNTESNSFNTLNDDIIKFMNTTNNQDNNTDPENVETEEEIEQETENVETEEVTDKFTIINPSDEVDETAQSEINKIELKNILENGINNNIEGAKEAIEETFALIKSIDKKTDWQQPHHIIKNNNIILNTNGLTTAALFLLKPAATKNISPDDKTIIAKHLLKHYNELKLEAPVKLNNMSEGKESVIMLNLQEDDLKEFGQIFEVDVEDVAVYVGLMESLLTDFVNSGIINIDNDDNKESTDSMVSIKLSKEQAKEMIEYFDIMANDIAHLLNSDFKALSYKKTDTQLNESFLNSQTELKNLQEMIEELEQTIKERNDEIANLNNANNEVKLDQIKFEAIVNFIKSVDNIDETLVQFINNVIEAENKRDIDYLNKIGSTFMKNSYNPPKFKKVAMLNHASINDLQTITNLIDNDGLDINSNNSEITNKINQLSELF